MARFRVQEGVVVNSRGEVVGRLATPDDTHVGFLFLPFARRSLDDTYEVIGGSFVRIRDDDEPEVYSETASAG